MFKSFEVPRKIQIQIYVFYFCFHIAYGLKGYPRYESFEFRVQKYLYIILRDFLSTSLKRRQNFFEKLSNSLRLKFLVVPPNLFKRIKI